MPCRALLSATERCLAGDDSRDEVPLASRERYRGVILVHAARVPEELECATGFKTKAARCLYFKDEEGHERQLALFI